MPSSLLAHPNPTQPSNRVIQPFTPGAPQNGRMPFDPGSVIRKAGTARSYRLLEGELQSSPSGMAMFTPDRYRHPLSDGTYTNSVVYGPAWPICPIPLRMASSQRAHRRAARSLRPRSTWQARLGRFPRGGPDLKRSASGHRCAKVRLAAGHSTSGSEYGQDARRQIRHYREGPRPVGIPSAQTGPLWLPPTVGFN